MKKRGHGFSLNQRCEYCRDAVFHKPFYVFPCSHCLHSECIIEKLSDYMEKSTINVVVSVDQDLKSAIVRSSDNDKRAIIQQESLQNLLDSYIANECPLCGHAIIKLLEKPLITGDDKYLEAKLWNLGQKSS